jgi:hypothetical protein
MKVCILSLCWPRKDIVALAHNHSRAEALRHRPNARTANWRIDVWI